MSLLCGHYKAYNAVPDASHPESVYVHYQRFLNDVRVSEQYLTTPFAMLLDLF